MYIYMRDQIYIYLYIFYTSYIICIILLANERKTLAE